MEKPLIKVTRPKPAFSGYFINNPDESLELNREKYREAIQKWQWDCYHWRLDNQTPPALLATPPPLSEGVFTPLGVLGGYFSQKGRSGCLVKWTLGYIGFIIGFLIIKEIFV